MASEAISVVRLVGEAAYKIYKQVQEVKHLRRLAEDLKERVAIIDKITKSPEFEEQGYADANPTINEALKATRETLKKVEKYLEKLSKEGIKEEARVFLFVGSYVKEYEELARDLIRDIELLHAAVGIKTTHQVDKIAKESDVIQEMLIEVRANLVGAFNQAERNGENLVDLKAYLESLNKSIGELKNNKNINREFREKCAIANFEDTLAMRVVKPEDRRTAKELRYLMKSVPKGMSAKFDCAEANKAGTIAVVISVYDTQDFKAIVAFLDRQQKSSVNSGSLSGNYSPRFHSPLRAESPEKADRKAVKGISLERISDNVFNVNIDYEELGLSKQQVALLQATLKGDKGEGAYKRYKRDSSTVNEDGYIERLAFTKEEYAKDLISTLTAKVLELQSSAQSGASFCPK